MKAIMLICVGFLLGVAFVIVTLMALIVIAAPGKGREPTKEEWKLR